MVLCYSFSGSDPDAILNVDRRNVALVEIYFSLHFILKLIPINIKFQNLIMSSRVRNDSSRKQANTSTPSGATRSDTPQGKPSAAATPSGKLSVPEPTSLRKFAVILLMYFCKRVLLIETLTKLCVYFCGITVISVVTDHFPFPKSYFSDKHNLFNQYFVKMGWGWTCSILGLFIYFTR